MSDFVRSLEQVRKALTEQFYAVSFLLRADYAAHGNKFFNSCVLLKHGQIAKMN